MSAPQTVYFELAHQINSGWMAGEFRVMQVFGCTASDVRVWAPAPDPDMYMDEGVEVFEANGALGLNLDRNGRLICGRLVVRQVPDRSVPIEPYVDPHSFSAVIRLQALPSPAQWLGWFREAGEDVVWRVYGGGEWPPADLSGGGYAGFVQRRQDIAASAGGIFVEVRYESGGFRVALTHRPPPADPPYGQLWQVIQHCLRRFPDAQFLSGNCPFTQQEWQRYISSGVLPDYRTDDDAGGHSHL